MRLVDQRTGRSLDVDLSTAEGLAQYDGMKGHVVFTHTASLEPIAPDSAEAERLRHQIKKAVDDGTNE